MVFKVGIRIEDEKDRLNDLLKLVRRYDEAKSIDPVPDQVKKACIISNTLKQRKTHLQLNVGILGNFDALSAAIKNYSRSSRIFQTTALVHTHDEDSMKVDAVSRKGRGKENSGRARRVARKEKKATQAKVTVSKILRTPALRR